MMNEDSFTDALQSVTDGQAADRHLLEKAAWNKTEIKDFLKVEKAAGNHFVAYDTGLSTLSKEDMQTFRSAYEAKKFCYENSNGLQIYQAITIEHMERVLGGSRARENTLDR